MIITPVFPTAIGRVENPFLAQRVRPVIHTILDDERNHSQGMSYPSTHDPVNPYPSREPQLESMREYLHDLAVDYVQQLGYRTDLMALSTEMHFNRMRAGDSHQRHLHSGNIIASGTFYVDFPQGAAPLVLWDPRLHREMTAFPYTPTQYTQSRHTLEPKTGTIFLMEGYLQHSVPENTQSGRTVVLFNLLNQ